MDNTYTQAVLRLLDKHVAQRSGLEFANYGDVTSYRAEQRSITRDLHDYRAIRGAVHWRTFTREQWADAFRVFSGRLTLEHDADGNPVRLEYVTRQYFPTEYRKAACAVLATLLWEHTRWNSMPIPTTHLDAGTGCTVERYKGLLAGDYLAKYFRNELGRGIASRWFQ